MKKLFTNKKLNKVLELCGSDIEKRKVELLSGISSFEKNSFTSMQLANEYIKFEKEIVGLCFNEQHSHFGNLKVRDVNQHLIQLNTKCNNLLTNELNDFLSISKVVSNEIGKYTSGKFGEDKTFARLQTLGIKNVILRNIVLEFDGYKCEYDFIVITQRTIYILEVKNTRSGIKIDNKGNYYRKVKGEYILDSNIGDKMNQRRYVLEGVFRKKGYRDLSVKSLLVYTNYQADVINDYEFLRHVYLSELPNIIREDKNQLNYNTKDLEKMNSYLKAMHKEEVYDVEVDINQYKNKLCDILSKLEIISSNEELQKRNNSIFSRIYNLLRKPKLSISYASSLITLLSIVVSSLIKQL